MIRTKRWSDCRRSWSARWRSLVRPPSIVLRVPAIGPHLDAQVAQLFKDQPDARIEIPLALSVARHRHNLVARRAGLQRIRADTYTASTQRRRVARQDVRQVPSVEPADAEALRTHDDIPRPFVIAPPPAGPHEHPPGSHLVFDLTLVGRARQYLPHFVVTFRDMDRIGRGRRKVNLHRIEAVHPLTGASEVVYTAAENLVTPREATVTLAECAALACPEPPVRVTFVTQTRLKEGGGFACRPEFQLLFRRLLGRLSSLARFHSDGPLDVDFRALIEAAGAVRLIRDATQWTRWARYSGRQDRRMEWEGLVGRIEYDGDVTAFWPYLAFGLWTDPGSGTTFGLGRYCVEGVKP